MKASGGVWPLHGRAVVRRPAGGRWGIDAGTTSSVVGYLAVGPALQLRGAARGFVFAGEPLLAGGGTPGGFLVVKVRIARAFFGEFLTPGLLRLLRTPGAHGRRPIGRLFWRVFGDLLLLPCRVLMRAARERAQMRRFRDKWDESPRDRGTSRHAVAFPSPSEIGPLVCAPVTLPPGRPLTRYLHRLL